MLRGMSRHVCPGQLSGCAINILQAARGTGAAALVAWSTDTLLLPPLGVNCVLALLAALLGTSLRALGVGSDPLVRLNPPIVSLADLAAMQGCSVESFWSSAQCTRVG
jgi:hypothetical protein